MKNKLNTVVALALANGIQSTVRANRDKRKKALEAEGEKLIDKAAIRRIDDQIEQLRKKREATINKAVKVTPEYNRQINYGTRCQVSFNNSVPDPKAIRDELILLVNLHGKTIDQAKAELQKRYS